MEAGILVTCLNCGIIWRRITEDDGGVTGPALADIQKVCPACNSNAYAIKWQTPNEGRRKHEQAE